jgi:hypothetical protein
VRSLAAVFATVFFPAFLHGEEGAFWGFEGARTAYDGQVWFSELAGTSAYAAVVESLLGAFEERTGRQLVPEEHGRAALKVYTNSGVGLHTPRPLVRALIAALGKRGFARDDLFIVDARENLLRECGFLPPLSRMDAEGPYFEGVRVHALDSGALRSPTWFYESPLPREFTSPLGRELLKAPLQEDPEEARKSFLPTALLTDVDFWINLPMVSHHPAMGLSGALANASLWNITNGTRFFNSPANAPVAIAEIAAIPELLDTWAFTLLSLREYQYIGGPAYNANYTRESSRLLLAVDPVILDALMVQRVNAARAERGFEQLPPVPPFLEYAMELGLGQGIATGAVFRKAEPSISLAD